MLLSCFSGSPLSLEELELEELELEDDEDDDDDEEDDDEEDDEEDDDDEDDESHEALSLLCVAEAEISISFFVISSNRTTMSFDSLPSSFEHADASAATSVRWAFNVLFLPMPLFLADPETECNADSPLLSSLDLFRKSSQLYILY